MTGKAHCDTVTEDTTLGSPAYDGVTTSEEVHGDTTMDDDNVVTQQQLQELEHRLDGLHCQLVTMAEQPVLYSDGRYVIHRGVG